jgi:hypothetical protein
MIDQEPNQKMEQKFEGFCPACGEPQYKGKINHTAECPFAGDDLPPEEANH